MTGLSAAIEVNDTLHMLLTSLTVRDPSAETLIVPRVREA